MHFAEHFPEFKPEWFPALPPGFHDSSWCNDGQPSMTNEAICLHIWVDHPDSPHSNFDDGARFGVLLLNADGTGYAQDDPILVTDDWATVLALIETRTRAMAEG